MTAPKVTAITILEERETEVARHAVRAYLTVLRNQYRQDRKRGQHRYAAQRAETYAEVLDLYDRLDGDVADVPDLDAPPRAEP